MTPLEEIEQSIEYLNTIESNPDKRIRALGPLYQARAIERLEATVRAIGFMWQTYADETLPLMRKMARHADPHHRLPGGHVLRMRQGGRRAAPATLRASGDIVSKESIIP